MKNVSETSVDQLLIGAGGFVLVFLIFLPLLVLAHVAMFRKAGYSGVWGCLIFVPVIGTILLAWLAFSDWPALRGGGSKDDY